MVSYHAREIAEAGLKIGAIKLRPENPFTWASGFRMPIYNDNRRFIFGQDTRDLVADALYDATLKFFSPNASSIVVAGTSTAGIPWGTLLAEQLKANFVYVRDKPKDHGLRNQIEGIDAESGLDRRRVLLVEDLVSTGGSSVKAVQALRDADGDCRNCLSIFNYGLEEAQKPFRELSPPCEVGSLLTYDVLIQVAKETGHIKPEQVAMLEEWRQDPFGWGEKHGFPKVEKK